MKIIEYARNKKLSLADAAVELDLHYSVDIWLTEQIYADLTNIQRSNRYV